MKSLQLSKLYIFAFFENFMYEYNIFTSFKYCHLAFQFSIVPTPSCIHDIFYNHYFLRATESHACCPYINMFRCDQLGVDKLQLITENKLILLLSTTIGCV